MMALAWEMCISSWCNWYGRRKIDGHGVLQIHCLLVGHKIHTSHQRGRPCNVRFTYDKTSKQVSSSKMDAELSRTGCFSISTARPHTQERTSHKSHGTRGVPEVTPSEGFDTAISMPCRITNLDVLSPVEGVIGRFIGRRVRAALTGRCANAEGAAACRRRQ